MLRTKRKVPSLVDLCVSLAVENVKYLGDVGETDLHLLDRILPHCTLDQLMHIEKSTVGRDLSSVTDKLWKTFYEKQFGERSTDVVIQRMRQKKVSFRWLQLYEAKLKDIAEAENKLAARIRQLYKKEDDSMFIYLFSKYIKKLNLLIFFFYKGFVFISCMCYGVFCCMHFAFRIT